MAGTCGSDGGGGEIMLFGVRVVVDSMRKSVSLNNLSQYEQPHDLKNLTTAAAAATADTKDSKKDDVAAGSGYASADDAVPHSSSTRGERKRGVPWTEEEHKLFLIGLQKVGKGDWRGISRNFVKTRTPTQVASHAQKYFLRRSNLNRRRRRSSLFDITTDTVTAFPMEEEQAHHQDNSTSNSNSSPRSNPLPQLPENSSSSSNILPSVMSMPMGMPMPPGFSMTTASTVVLPVPIESPMENLSLLQGNPPAFSTSSANLIGPIAFIPAATPPTATTGMSSSDINLNLKTSTADSSTLSLKLSLPYDQRDSPSASRHSDFQVMSSFNNGDGIITVA